MFCYNCGKQISDGSRFCSFCGADLVREDLEYVSDSSVSNSSPDDYNTSESANTVLNHNNPGKVRFMFESTNKKLQSIVILIDEIQERIELSGGNKAEVELYEGEYSLRFFFGKKMYYRCIQIHSENTEIAITCIASLFNDIKVNNKNEITVDRDLFDYDGENVNSFEKRLRSAGFINIKRKGDGGLSSNSSVWKVLVNKTKCDEDDFWEGYEVEDENGDIKLMMPFDIEITIVY